MGKSMENKMFNMKLTSLLAAVIFIIGMSAGIAAAIDTNDVSVWQGQYYTGTTFNEGTYEFDFTVYDSLTAGTQCYSNKTNITTGHWGQWETEQSGVNYACNNASKDYYLNINIDGADQLPRKRLTTWNFLRKNVDETTSGKFQTNIQIIAPVIQAQAQVVAPVVNATQIVTTNITTETGFFSWLGSLASRITKLFVQDVDATGNIETSQNVSANYFMGDGSLLTNLPAGINGTNGKDGVNGTQGPQGAQGIQGPQGIQGIPGTNGTNGVSPNYLGSNLTATNANYTTIFTIVLTPSKMNVIHAYLVQSSSANGVAIQNRAIISASGPVGNCHFVTQTQSGGEAVDNIVVSNNSADTGSTIMGLDTNVPFINTVICTVLADANQRNLIIQFESETVATVTTYTGSYYQNAVS